MIRLLSRLDDETEKNIFETMACGFAVHKAIGPGYGESFYRNAFCIELLERKIPFESEKAFVVNYRDRPVGTHRLDLIVRGRVVVELKAVKRLKRVHEAQSTRSAFHRAIVPIVSSWLRWVRLDPLPLCFHVRQRG